MRVAMSYIFLPRATFDTTVKMISVVQGSHSTGRTLITAAPSVRYTVISVYDIIARYSSKSRSRDRSNLNAPAFDRVRDGGGPGSQIHLHS